MWPEWAFQPSFAKVHLVAKRSKLYKQTNHFNSLNPVSDLCLHLQHCSHSKGWGPGSHNRVMQSQFFMSCPPVCPASISPLIFSSPSFATCQSDQAGMRQWPWGTECPWWSRKPVPQCKPQRFERHRGGGGRKAPRADKAIGLESLSK